MVTGATCELGVAIARTLGAAGAHIALAGRRLNDVEARCAGLRDDGIDATAFRVDVADHESCTTAITEIMERFGRVDVLVNNAGVGNAAPAMREDPAQFRHTIEVNLMDAYWMSQACGRVMQRGSAVVMISSILGLTTTTPGGLRVEQGWTPGSHPRPCSTMDRPQGDPGQCRGAGLLVDRPPN